MLRRILYFIANRLPCRLIDHKGAPYMERHLLGTIFNTRIYLHRFVASDPAGVHDHPFENAISLILAGWYFEDRWGKRYLRKWFNRLSADSLHRVVLPNNGKDVWTVFIHSPRVRPWGFFKVTRSQDNGSVLEYTPESSKEDPAFSDWSKDRTGAEMRQHRDSAGKGIPFGMNVYSMGYVEYPMEDLEFTRQNQKQA